MAPGPTLTNGASSAKQATAPDLALSSAALDQQSPCSVLSPASTRTPQRTSLTNPTSRLRINIASPFFTCAQVAELADALASGASGLTVVEVRVLSWAPNISKYLCRYRDWLPCLFARCQS